MDVISSQDPQPGRRIHGAVTLRAGGSAANAAVWSAALGASAAVIGRVGTDAAGELVERTLQEHGVETLLARDPELPTGTAVALGSTVVAAPSASARLASEDVPEPLVADTLLVSGFSLFQRGSVGGARAALERFDGRLAAVDLASPRLAADANLEELCAGANVVLATAEEAHAVTGMDPEAAVRELAGRFEVACVKLGEQGAVAAQGDRLSHARARPVERQSLFGAGDAFGAALLVSLARSESLGDALTAACEAGARAAASPSGWPDGDEPPSG